MPDFLPEVDVESALWRMERARFGRIFAGKEERR
jgi:hypothetical protein